MTAFPKKGSTYWDFESFTPRGSSNLPPGEIRISPPGRFELGCWRGGAARSGPGPTGCWVLPDPHPCASSP
eukprot:6218733-Prymnesium_polylepis.1